jgi:uncharacterized protein YdaU (DUF1376 family)
MHYFKFNIKDYHFATKHFNYIEHGAYLVLMSVLYETEKPLTVNMNELIKTCMARNEEEINAIKYVLENFFTKTEDGYVQKRAMAELDHYKSNGEKKSYASHVRWSKHKNKKSDADAMQMDSTNDANQETENNKHETVYTSEKFLEFWDTWPKSKRKAAKPECFRKWKKNHLDTIADKIIAHVDACKDSEQWRNGYEPAPLTYLNQGRYEDEVETVHDWTVKKAV